MVSERPFREIRQADVGKPVFYGFGRRWFCCEFIGRILPGDVGKRVYRFGGIDGGGALQVESDRQRAERLAEEVSHG